MDYSKLEKIIDDFLHKNKLNKAEFCEKIKMTPQGLYKMFKEKSTKVETLETIANVIGTSPAMFFDVNDQFIVNEDLPSYGVDIDIKELKEKLMQYDQQLKIKDTIIKCYQDLYFAASKKDSKE